MVRCIVCGGEHSTVEEVMRCAERHRRGHQGEQRQEEKGVGTILVREWRLVPGEWREATEEEKREIMRMMESMRRMEERMRRFWERMDRFWEKVDEAFKELFGD